MRRKLTRQINQNVSITQSVNILEFSTETNLAPFTSRTLCGNPEISIFYIDRQDFRGGFLSV